MFVNSGAVPWLHTRVRLRLTICASESLVCLPHGASDLLFALSAQVLAQTSPAEDCEPASQVALNPILSVLNLSLKHYARSHRNHSFLRPSAQSALRCLSPRPFLRRNRLSQIRTVAHDSRSAKCAACTRDRAKRPAGLARLQWSIGAPH